MPKPKPLTNAEKQAAWRKRRQAKLEALEKENAKLKRELRQRSQKKENGR